MPETQYLLTDNLKMGVSFGCNLLYKRVSKSVKYASGTLKPAVEGAYSRIESVSNLASNLVEKVSK